MLYAPAVTTVRLKVMVFAAVSTVPTLYVPATVPQLGMGVGTGVTKLLLSVAEGGQL
jgi:hypothetical protein